MRKKIGFIILSFAMLFCSFGVVGCSSDKAISNTNKSLQEFMSLVNEEGVKDEDKIFISGTVHDVVTTDYKVSYGNEKINTYISDDITKIELTKSTNNGQYAQTFEATYSDLDYMYNSLFAVSVNYISEYSNTFNYAVVGASYSKTQKKALKNLRQSVASFKKVFSKFKAAREEFIYYYQNSEAHNGSTNGEIDQLRKYEKTYGDLVGKAVDVAQKLVDAREKIVYYGTIDEVRSRNVIKEYAVVQTLDMFYEFYIGQMSSKVVYSSTKDTVDKAYIYDIYDNVYNNLSDIMSRLVAVQSTKENLSEEEIEEVMASINAVINDKNIFVKALKDFNIAKFGVDYDNDLASYLNKKSTAMVDIEKMTQISKDIMPMYINLIANIL